LPSGAVEKIFQIGGKAVQLQSEERSSHHFKTMFREASADEDSAPTKPVKIAARNFAPALSGLKQGNGLPDAHLDVPISPLR